MPERKDEEGAAAVAAVKAVQPALVQRVTDPYEWTPDRLKALRATRLDLSQAEFATAYHLELRTICDWEQDKRRPAGPARTLLVLIEREPELIRKILAKARRKGE